MFRRKKLYWLGLSHDEVGAVLDVLNTEARRFQIVNPNSPVLSAKKKFEELWWKIVQSSR